MSLDPNLAIYERKIADVYSSEEEAHVSVQKNTTYFVDKLADLNQRLLQTLTDIFDEDAIRVAITRTASLDIEIKNLKNEFKKFSPNLSIEIDDINKIYSTIKRTQKNCRTRFELLETRFKLLEKKFELLDKMNRTKD